MERMVKMTKKDQGERGMEKNPLLPPDRKQYMVTNSLWRRAMWQRLETPRVIHAHNTKHTMMLTATGHWTDAHEVPI